MVLSSLLAKALGAIGWVEFGFIDGYSLSRGLQPKSPISHKLPALKPCPDALGV
jgi:hypothetical protein